MSTTGLPITIKEALVMNQLSGKNPQITISLLLLVAVSLACNTPDAVKVLIGAAVEHCFSVSRAEYESSAVQLGRTPQQPKYPDSAVYEVCQVEGQTTSVRMTDGEKPDETNIIPTGTYTGKPSFYTTLEGDDEFLDPVCSENTIRVVIGSDGVAQGEIRSICSSKMDTDNEDMGQTHHSNVTGTVEGELLDNTGQLSISYTWHSYFTSPQWETTSLDETVEPVYSYQVEVVSGVMTLTPAAEVEDYYSFTLSKE
jgi:hypothetical protein